MKVPKISQKARERHPFLTEMVTKGVLAFKKKANNHVANWQCEILPIYRCVRLLGKEFVLFFRLGAEYQTLTCLIFNSCELFEYPCKSQFTLSVTTQTGNKNATSF